MFIFSYQQQPKTEGSKESASQDGVSEIYSRKETVSNKTRTDSQNTDTDVKSSVKTKAAPKKSETKEKGFGGFPKGFLSGSNTKSKPETRSSSSSSKKKTDTKEEIPYIEKKDDSESLRLSEVQETMNKTSENLMKNQGRSGLIRARSLDKREYLMIIILISHQNHVL